MKKYPIPQIFNFHSEYNTTVGLTYARSYGWSQSMYEKNIALLQPCFDQQIVKLNDESIQKSCKLICHNTTILKQISNVHHHYNKWLFAICQLSMWCVRSNLYGDFSILLADYSVILLRKKGKWKKSEFVPTDGFCYQLFFSCRLHIYHMLQALSFLIKVDTNDLFSRRLKCIFSFPMHHPLCILHLIFIWIVYISFSTWWVP